MRRGEDPSDDVGYFEDVELKLLYLKRTFRNDRSFRVRYI